MIAGGSVGAVEPLAAAVPYSRQFNFELQPLKDLDLACAELAEALPLDVMPGADDHANVSLPQQPLHKCLFPGARAAAAAPARGAAPGVWCRRCWRDSRRAVRAAGVRARVLLPRAELSACCPGLLQALHATAASAA